MFDQLKSLITELPDYNLSQQGEHLIDSIMQQSDGCQVKKAQFTIIPLMVAWCIQSKDI